MTPGRREAEAQGYGQEYQQPYSPQAAGYPPDPATFNPNQPMYPPTHPGGSLSPQPEYMGQPAQPGPQIHPDYGYQQQAGYAPPEPNAYSPPPGANPYAGGVGPRRADENVSAEPSHDTPKAPVINEPAPMYNSEGIPFYGTPNFSSNRDGGSDL